MLLPLLPICQGLGIIQLCCIVCFVDFAVKRTGLGCEQVSSGKMKLLVLRSRAQQHCSRGHRTAGAWDGLHGYEVLHLTTVPTSCSGLVGNQLSSDWSEL